MTAFKPSDRPASTHRPTSSIDAYKAALKDVVRVQGKPLPSPKSVPQQLPLSRSRTQDGSYPQSNPDDGIRKSAARMSRSNTTDSRSGKKPGKHFDVIDSWDVTAVTGSALWHHDSPYDAASPSRNDSHKAPVKAFDAQMMNESREVKPAETEDEKETRLREEKKKRNPLLEVWGKHEEEPWEAFSSGAKNLPSGGARMTSDMYQESPLLPPKPTRRPSTRIPPPRPIKMDDGIDPDKPIQWSGSSARSSSVGPSDTMRRSQSLLKRWKSSRRSPKSQSGGNSTASQTPSISPSPSAYDKNLPEPPTGKSEKEETPPPETPIKEKENEVEPLLTRKRSLLDKVKVLGKGVRARSKDAKVAN